MSVEDHVVAADARLGADLAVVNATIHTFEPGQPVQDAIAVRDGRVLAVGSQADLAPLLHPATTVVDAGGRAVLPGLIDAHTHFQKAALARLLFIDYLELSPSSVDDVVREVAQRAVGLSPGNWIRGESLNEHLLAEDRFPSRLELDAVARDHPVVIFGTGNHVIAANSLALAAAGISAATADPAGGRIERDDAGEPTGVLRELGKLRLDPNRPDSVLPPIAPEHRREAIVAATRHLHSLGITSIHDIVMDPAEVEAYAELHAAGKLRLRVQMLMRGLESKIPLDAIIATGLRQPMGDTWLRFGGVKMSIDGICAWRNAAVHEPYPGEPENVGLVRIPPDVLDDAVARCQEHGLRVAIHAIGQRAVDMALDAFSAAFSRYGRKPQLRHRIEHAYLPPMRGQLERMAQLGLIVSPQPAFLRDLGDTWHDIWGTTGTDEIMPLRSMLAAGLVMPGSSDYPCVPIDPWLGIAAAVNRRTRSGRVLGADQSISVREALAMRTTAAAYAGYEEHLKGTLTPGKLADLIVVSADPFAAPPERLADIAVDMTIVNGEVVYQRDDRF